MYVFAEKMEVTADDFEYIVKKLKEENVLTHGGARQIIAEERMKRRGSTGTYPCTTKEKSKGSLFPEPFLTRAARSSNSQSPIIRIDEWNGSSKKLHKHGVFPMDNKSISLMNNRCRTRLSETSAVLNDSLLSLQSELDDDIYEESTPENKYLLEQYRSRSFILTVSHRAKENKQLIVTIEDEDDKADEKEEKKNDMLGGVEYKDKNISLRSVYQMEYSLKRISFKNRTVSVKEVEYLS